ncbi:thioesterase [Gilvibacter sp. SZ-19]|uniref:PaaI family thioesterase n=1 Tax=unclassified Gilvibacter TaxID=2625242 RepID=UPI000B3CB617|nr:hotdog fold thioesterase [Gilvibacter sp. SZ-19]ARV10908.1 thioesterase [Gilvibacter sp. SZ-19]
MQYTKEELLARCNQMCKNTLMETLDIEFVDYDEHSITAKMPVNPRVHQPDGVLHGGATVALAESVGSAAAFIFLAAENVQVRGIEIAANHVKSIREGEVFAKAEIMHKGRTTQLWQIRITDHLNNLISLVKLTTLTLYQD